MKKLFLGEAPRLWKQIIRRFLTVGYKKKKYEYYYSNSCGMY